MRPPTVGSSRSEVGFAGRFRLWMAPGMRVKRYIAMAVLGGIIMSVAVVASAIWLLADARNQLSGPIERILVTEAWGRIGGFASIAVVLAGATMLTRSVVQLNRSLLSHWMPQPKDAAVLLHKRLQLSRGPRVVAVGGGTGLSNLLRGLRESTSNVTAVVAVSDDGGSSGRLREAFDMPAPGDLSDCLAAMSDQEVEVSRLMEFRFERGKELEGHTFGNLLITTLSEVEGDIAKASRVLNRLLNLSGAVWPVTPAPVSLVARKADGRVVTGETSIRASEGSVDQISVLPDGVPAVPEVLVALKSADLIVLGPGSLYSSVLPSLLVDEVRQVINETPAPVLYVCNIMTEAGETDRFDAFDHVEAIHRHLGRYPDLVLVNRTPLDSARLAAYELEGAEEVMVSVGRFNESGVQLAYADLLGPGRFAQHDSDRLATTLIELAEASRSGVPIA